MKPKLFSIKTLSKQSTAILIHAYFNSALTNTIKISYDFFPTAIFCLYQLSFYLPPTYEEIAKLVLASSAPIALIPHYQSLKSFICRFWFWTPIFFVWNVAKYSRKVTELETVGWLLQTCRHDLVVQSISQTSLTREQKKQWLIFRLLLR